MSPRSTHIAQGTLIHKQILVSGHVDRVSKRPRKFIDSVYDRKKDAFTDSHTRILRRHVLGSQLYSWRPWK